MEIYTKRKRERESETKSHVYICALCSAYISYHVNRFQCFWIHYESETETERKRERQVMYIYVYIVKPLKNLFIRAVRTTQMIQENENLRMESRKETRHADRNGGIKWNGTYSE